MPYPSFLRLLVLVAAPAALLAYALPARAMDIVKDGKPVATIVVVKSLTPQEAASYRGGAGEGEDEGERPAKGKGRGGRGAAAAEQVSLDGPDAEAAKILVDWVSKMTGVTLPVAETAPAGRPAIYVGVAAMRAGLKLDDIKSDSREGVRIRSDESRVLIAGQQPRATAKAACRFLEEFGCRMFMDGAIGEVYPTLTTLVAGKLDITEQPGFIYRNPKGPNWGHSFWRTWNGGGGTPVSHSHSWGGWVPESLNQEHPEFFAQKADGTRPPSAWLCTSNPGLREFFANRVIERIKEGTKNPSLSPTDGTGYCQCPACKAQDDPNLIEPSSKRVSMTTRYVDFFSDVARRVGRVYPDSLLSFYVYADYTQPPASTAALPPNLLPFIAPIRYCRLHTIGDPICPDRVQQQQLMEGWSKISHQTGYYYYSYDLAEATVPVAMLARLKHDIPYIKAHGCVALTEEVLTNWHLYGPSLYLGLKLAYNPAADADAIMEDYYQRFYGPAAAPYMKEYWTTLDQGIAKLNCHAGSFFWIQSLYTPEFLARLKKPLDQAAEAAKSQGRYAERVQLAREGYTSAAEYMDMWHAMEKGDFATTKHIYDAYMSRMSVLASKGWANPEYGAGDKCYMARFNSKVIEAGAVATAPPNKLLQVLPDKWRMTYDPEGKGLDLQYELPACNDGNWKEVATYSQTLSAQGMPDRTEVMWYRTSFEAPAKPGKLALFFGEIDGMPEVYVNGQKVEMVAGQQAAGQPRGERAGAKAQAGGRNGAGAKGGGGKGGKGGKAAAAAAAPAAPANATPTVDGERTLARAAAQPTTGRKRAPFEVDIAGVVQPGRNVVAVRVDHTKISDLNLGGIIRPVYLIERGE